MVAGSLSDELVSPVSVGRLWKACVKDAHNLIPKIMPHMISSVEVCEGNGGVGTVKKINFTKEIKGYTYVKDKTVALDDEKFFLKYSLIEGGLIGKKFKSVSIEFKFEEGANGGSVSKMKTEYETIGDAPLSEVEGKEMKENLLSMFKAVEGYLLQNHDAYA
ncbi:major pollen allergen Bet v 1-F/I [Amborella trichopoda]|uniref:Bet v I/Major latex protein domain-containing protein n=1 Tax=Amborella trichopoda TaxID=13333 RepID=W1P8A6_AMBTC|nr:major pollen allergen Bet v 1-F/I [Amborella trichopoda]ERN03205.1 hypothetical protein AMTR_s00003p00153740 [Amborella trichopoda]|eukprot:XP_006841530.1 major pollen allergen Bet v 1-F/I [Amborella trichopoda]